MTTTSCHLKFETEETKKRTGKSHRGKGRPRKELDIALYKKLKNSQAMSNTRMARLQGMSKGVLIERLKEVGLYEYPADNRMPPLTKKQIENKEKYKEKSQNKALETTLIPSSYEIIWDYKLLCLIHSRCGQRIKVRIFEKGYRTSPKEYRKHVLLAIRKHKYQMKRK
jgi:hypothetical protein